MKFLGTVVFEGDGLDELLEWCARPSPATVVKQWITRGKTRVRCQCTWATAAEAANGPWRARVAPLLAQADRHNVVEIARRVDQLFQQRMRAMVRHPAYGRADPRCGSCGGRGRAVGDVSDKFDYYGQLPGRWGEVLTTPCRTAEIWPWSDDLWLKFYLICSEAGLPTIRFHELYSPEVFPPIAPAVTRALDGGGATVPVSRLLEIDAVPDTLVCVDPAGRWLEREEVEFAEDLASWHGRIQNVLRENPTARVAVVDFHV